jgi:type IV pilus assembly protein PilF
MESDITDRYVRAEKYFRIVLQRNPNTPEALLNMSKLSVQQGKYLPGRAYLQRYQAVGKHTAETLWLGIQIEENLGDKKTLAAYKRQLRNDFPDSEEAGKLGKN